MSKPSSGYYTKNHPVGKVLIEKLKEQYSEQITTDRDIIGILEDKNGKIIWLESGKHTGRGLKHIVDKHLSQFENIGVSREILPIFILNVVAYGAIIGYQGTDKTRPIFTYTYSEKNYLIAVTISDNGFIVGANPRTKLKAKEKLET